MERIKLGQEASNKIQALLILKRKQRIKTLIPAPRYDEIYLTAMKKLEEEELFSENYDAP